ncbi:fructose-bisphosphatase class II [Mycoplasma sp. SG1]|uniref:fructose-bisphosphatase class II n=1 Tax=Mycoplasma sp. SG1 TaxID=2810348 RepID=UPI0020250D46|nr:fructose-bisphosphatase class II [Mycoplasma sp. SG1]URM52861.1 fructose-bisphosphatase class II family protein [Mycoplasma sp. SG1]
MKPIKLVSIFQDLVANTAAVAYSLNKKSKSVKEIDNHVTDMIDKTLKGIKDYNFEVLNFEGILDKCKILDGLYINKPNDSKVDFELTIDPIEGTKNLVNKCGACCSVILCTEPGATWNVPEMYLEKIFINKKYKDFLTLDKPLEEQLKILTQTFKDKQFTGIILNKPRHKKIIAIFKKYGINIILVNDGDFIVTLDVVFGKADFVYGTGCSPEAILMAALAIINGFSFQGIFVPSDSVHPQLLSNEQKLIENRFLESLPSKKTFFENDFIKSKNPSLFISIINPTLSKNGIEEINGQLSVPLITFFDLKIKQSKKLILIN